MAVPQQTMLADRYGRPAPWRRRVLLACVAALALASSAWLGWTIWEQSRPLVSSGELTYDIQGENSVVVRFDVDFRDDHPVTASCTLKAYAPDHTLVGQVTFAPDPDDDGHVTHTLSTDRRATSVELVGCTASGQPRPR